MTTIDHLKSKADALLSVAISTGAVPGATAMAVTADGVIYEGGGGVRALGAPAPMDPDTVCWIASMTKPLTSLAALQLVERGTLSLEQPASEVLPELADIAVLEGFDAGGAPRLRPAARPVTLRTLLSHTSGFGYEFFNGDFVKAAAALGLPAIGEGKIATLKAPLLFDPGARWEYGVGIDWAGRMVEAATGKTLGAFLADNLFEPLGMTSTAFVPTPAMQERLASVHVRMPDGGLAPFPLSMPPAPEFQSGGGGLYSTARDYARFVRMVLNGGALDGKRVLGSASMPLLTVNQIGALQAGALKSVTPMALDSEFFPGVKKGWSLAFAVNEAPTPTGRSAGGLMWAGLSNCFFWIDPRAGLGGVMLSQLLPFADPGPMKLWQDFETAVYDAAR